MGGFSGRKEHKQSEWGGGKLGLEISYAEVVKRQKNRDRNLVRMELSRRRGPGNLGANTGKSLGVERQPGASKAGKEQGSAGVQAFGRSYLGNDCRVTIIAMEPDHFEKSGEECGGFIAMDPRTEKLQELQWARILIRTDGEDLPSVLEIAVEEKVYSLVLWWELKPALRKAQENRREATVRTRGEVRGDGVSRADTRVEKELESTRLEALLLSEERMGVQEGGLGRELAKRAQGGLGDRPTMDVVDLGPYSATVGLNLKLKEVMGEVAGPKVGPSKKWWTAEEESPLCDGGMDLDDSPSKPPLSKH
ncbi:hypothetical protein AAG906_026062 [Vitis piasezkii]